MNFKFRVDEKRAYLFKAQTEQEPEDIEPESITICHSIANK